MSSVLLFAGLIYTDECDIQFCPSLDLYSRSLSICELSRAFFIRYILLFSQNYRHVQSAIFRPTQNLLDRQSTLSSVMTTRSPCTNKMHTCSHTAFAISHNYPPVICFCVFVLIVWRIFTSSMHSLNASFAPSSSGRISIR